MRIINEDGGVFGETGTDREVGWSQKRPLIRARLGLSDDGCK